MQADQSPSGEYVTTAEAAEILGVTREHVSRLARDGALAEAMKAPGLRGSRWFARVDVEQLKADRALAAAPAP